MVLRGGKDEDLHPDFVFDEAPADIWTTGRRVQFVLSYDCDGTDPVFRQRNGFRCDGMVGFDSHSTIGEDDGDTNLLRLVHMQRPKQRHGHHQKQEIDKNVAETEHDFHLGGRDWTHGGGPVAHAKNESTSYRPAGEDDQENTDQGPQGHDEADCPGGVAEFRDDPEDPIHEDEDGEFGKGDGDDVEQAIGHYELFAMD